MLRAIGLVVCHAALAASQADNGGFGIHIENGDAFGIVDEANTVVGSSSQGVPGYTTYRLSLELAGDAANVYTIFGREGMSMSFPPAFQVPVPFGANVSRTLVLPKKICAR